MAAANPVRTRIAPSPTGLLHVGTARAALFNELFARQHEGTFVVRIEDTDKERSTKESEEHILEGLSWLGLTWDEGPDVGGPHGPYRQSERTKHYQQTIAQLLESGAAYQESGETAVKLKVGTEPVVFTDLVRGTVTIEPTAWGGDFVIARSETDPVYHLAVVVDDAAMEISHVIRGEDHLTNTARHILIQQALGLPTPQYAHLPLLLDEQKKKLSKRAGTVDLLAFREQGILAPALLNYLALLGWNPKDDTEIMDHHELIRRFSLGGVQKGGAIWTEEKLHAFNKAYLRQLSPTEFLSAATPFLTAAGYDSADTDYWSRALATEQERVATLAEVPEAVAFFKPSWEADYEPSLLVWKKSDAARTTELLELLENFLQTLSAEAFTVSALEKELLDWIDSANLGRGDTLWPLRVALTGRAHSPGPFEVSAVLGKTETVRRVALAKGNLTPAARKTTLKPMHHIRGWKRVVYIIITVMVGLGMVSLTFLY